VSNNFITLRMAMIVGMLVAPHTLRAFEVSGSITTTTWTVANSPYVVIDSVTLVSGNTLTIEPDVDVVFDVDVPFLIEGSLRAHGTQSDSIRFLSGLSDTWRGLRISGGDSSFLSYTRISGGYATGPTREDSCGGGLHLSGVDTRFVLENGVISGNGSAWSGAGIKGTESAKGWFVNCRIVDNNAEHDGGGLYNTELCEIVFADCLIEGNYAGDDGGGMDNSGGIVMMTDVRISGNSAFDDAGGIGNHAEVGRAALTRCLVVDNSCGVDGGGIRNTGFAEMILMNCTIAGNTSRAGGGIYNEKSATIELLNCIVWKNSLVGISVESGSVTASWSCVAPFGGGIGNIGSDPMFIDDANGDFRLHSDSPCIDAGDPGSLRDLDGTLSDMGALPVDQGNLPPVWSIIGDQDVIYGEELEFTISSASDPNGDSLMYGVLELPNGATLVDSVFRMIPVAEQVGDTLAIFSVTDGEFSVFDTVHITIHQPVSVSLPVEYALHQNVPNPFNPNTTIPYDVATGGTVSLTIYDMSGRVVRSLVSGHRQSGMHEVVWDARDDKGRQVSSGVYVYRIESSDYRRARRMLLIR
jgi:hypothetical protein